MAQLLETRGFKTLLNWKSPRDVDDPGEVDLIATLGQHLFVIEVKSTFLRRSQREAWLYATSSLRKVGHRLRRKVEAVAGGVRQIGANPSSGEESGEELGECRGIKGRAGYTNQSLSVPGFPLIPPILDSSPISHPIIPLLNQRVRLKRGLNGPNLDQ